MLIFNNRSSNEMPASVRAVLAENFHEGNKVGKTARSIVARMVKEGIPSGSVGDLAHMITAFLSNGVQPVACKQ